jgi:hypothetical protein
MTSIHSFPHSTKVENLSFGPHEASFDMEGRTVQLRDAGNSPSVAAFRAFYDLAAADYRARAAAARPSWLSRLRNFVGRLFGAAAPEGGASRDADPPHPPHLPAVHPTPRRAREKREYHEAAPAPAESVRHPSHAAAAPRIQPILSAVFADEKGVHVIWQAPVRTQCKSLEFTYALDSGVAQRLQDCYGQLSQLGYKVVGLEIVTASRPIEVAGKTAAPQPSGADPKLAPDPKSAEPAAERPKAAAVRKRAAEAEPKPEVAPRPSLVPEP